MVCLEVSVRRFSGVHAIIAWIRFGSMWNVKRSQALIEIEAGSDWNFWSIVLSLVYSFISFHSSPCSPPFMCISESWTLFAQVESLRRYLRSEMPGFSFQKTQQSSCTFLRCGMTQTHGRIFIEFLGNQPLLYEFTIPMQFSSVHTISLPCAVWKREGEVGSLRHFRLI